MSSTEKISKHTIPDGTKVYKPAQPFTGKVVSNELITKEDNTDDVHHIVLDLSGSGMSYLEGQSLGILPPYTTSEGKPEKIRLYSIASSRKGDDGENSTVTLTVKRVLWTDDQTNETIRGVCSNYLCDLKANDELQITGPTGRTFLLPEDENTDLIMIGVGTGIAPFRAFINYIYKEKESWPGQVRLFFGAKTKSELLYMNEGRDDISMFFNQDTFKAFTALSREGGSKVYVQHRLEEQKSDIWPIVKRGQFALYICGLKGMESGITDVFTQWAKEEGMDWEQMKTDLRKQGRYNIEVY